MSDELAALIAPPVDHHVVSGVAVGQPATGGTLFANALSMAAGRAALEAVLTEEAFERARGLGARVADGLESMIEAAGLPWSVARMFSHCYYAFSPDPHVTPRSPRCGTTPTCRR